MTLGAGVRGGCYRSTRRRIRAGGEGRRWVVAGKGREWGEEPRKAAEEAVVGGGGGVGDGVKEASWYY